MSNGSELVGRTFSDELRIILIIVGVIMLASGILGNGLLLVVMWRRRKVRDFPNVFIANLALADLVVVCCGVPFYLVDLMVGRYPVVNVLHCRVNALILCIAYSVSITSLITISFNRYIKVCHTLLFHRIFSTRRNVAICGALWGFGLIANTPAFVPSVDFYGYDRGSHLCNAAGGEERLQYGSMAMASFLFFPVVLIGYFNSAIYKHWRESRKRVKGKWTQNDAVGLKNRPRLELEATTSETGDSGVNTDFTTEGVNGDTERKANAAELVKETENLGLNHTTESEPETIRDAAFANTQTAAVLSSDEKGGAWEPRPGMATAGMQLRGKNGAERTDTPSSSRRRSNSLPIISSEDVMELQTVSVKSVSSTSLIPRDDSPAAGSKGKASKQVPKGRKGSMTLSKKVLLHGLLLRSDFKMGSAQSILTRDTSTSDLSTVDQHKSSQPGKDDRRRDKKTRGVKKKTRAEVALVRSMLVISISLFILYAPFAVNLILSIFLEDRVPAELPVTSTLFLFVNCAINWIIYGVMNTVFRQAYVSTVKDVLCCWRMSKDRQ